MVDTQLCGAPAGAAGAAGAVRVVRRVAGQLQVDDCIAAGQVQPARGHIADHQRAQRAVAKLAQHRLTRLPDTTQCQRLMQLQLLQELPRPWPAAHATHPLTEVQSR